MNRFFKALGGRKSAAGFYASVLITGMAFPLKASFGEYAFSVCLALGLTNAAVAWEDAKSKMSKGADA